MLIFKYVFLEFILTLYLYNIYYIIFLNNNYIYLNLKEEYMMPAYILKFKKV